MSTSSARGQGGVRQALDGAAKLRDPGSDSADGIRAHLLSGCLPAAYAARESSEDLRYESAQRLKSTRRSVGWIRVGRGEHEHHRVSCGRTTGRRTVPGEDTYLVGSLRGGRLEVRVGAPDPSLTAVSGMAAVTELVERLGVVSAVGPIKQRDRGFGPGEVLVGLAAAQVAGEDFLVGLDRQRGDVAGQVITPVPGFVLDHGCRAGPQVHRSTMDGGGDRGRFGD